jgi:hypothetical protein
MEIAGAVTGRYVAGRIVLAAVGACGMIAGLPMLVLELLGGGPDRRTFVLAGAVLAAGGAALVFLHRTGVRPTAAGVLAPVLVGAAGAVAGLIRVTTDVCCAFAYLTGRGYPFEWLRRGGTADTLATARAETLTKAWNVHWQPLIADVAFWGFAGVLLAVAAALVRRAARGQGDG